MELALSITYAHDRRKIVVEDIRCGAGNASGGGRVGRYDQIDGRILCNRSGPLHIEVGFSLVIVSRYQSRIGTVVDDVQLLRGQTECGTEGIDVGGIDIRLAHDGNRLTGAVDACVPQGQYVVDRCKIVGGEKVEHSALICGCELRLRRDVTRCQLPPILYMLDHLWLRVQGLDRKVVKRSEADYDRGNRRRDLRVVRVGVVRPALDLVAMHLGMKGSF